MKKVLMGIALVLVIVIGGFFVAINMIEPETIQKEVAKIVQDMTGKPLHMDAIPSISFMPLGVSFGAVSWGEQKNTDISFAAKGGLVQMQFMPLLSGRMVIDKVRLDSPILTVAPPKASAKANNQATANETALPKLPLELASLEITNGQFLVNLSKTQQIKIDNFNATLANLKQGATTMLSVNTALDVSDPKLKGKLNVDANMTYDTAQILVHKFNVLYTPESGIVPAKMGPIDVSSKGMAFVLGAIPSIKGQITIKDIKLDALMAAQGGTSSSKKSTKSSAKTVYPQLDVAVDVKQASFKGLTFKDIHVHTKGKGGTSTTYAFNPVKATLASGGSLNAKSQVTLPAMQVQKEGTLKGLQVEPILTALQGKSPLSTVVDLNWNLNMVATSTPQIMKTLSGNGKIVAKNIVLKDGIEVPKNPITKQASFKEFSELSVPFTAKNGTVNIADASLVGQGVSAKGGGKVVLPSQTLNLKFDASALGMVIPITVGGTFAKPSYGIDPKWITNSLKGLPSSLIKGGAGAAGSIGKGAGEVVKGAEGIVKGTGEKAGKVGEEAGKLIKGLFGN